MAEGKYKMVLVQTKKEPKIYNHPWYKERLQTNYIKSRKPNDTSNFIQGKNWTFVKTGLDDFRDGLPPPVEGDIRIRGPKGFGPNIQGSSDNVSATEPAAAKGRFTKYEVCYSHITPQQQQHREHINEIEYGLMQHPLALYQHLEEGMPPDVFEDVVDILDPEMNLASDEEDAAFDDDQGFEDEEFTYKEAAPHVEDDEVTEEEKMVRNPYRWIPRKDDKEADKQTAGKKKNERRPSSPSQKLSEYIPSTSSLSLSTAKAISSASKDEHIKTVTKEFCDWVSSLGGESNNIEESTITSLFASGYETKPALSVPIHVVELTNVPLELRSPVNMAMHSGEENNTGPTQSLPPLKKKEWSFSGSYEPSWTRFKYGAWYLSPKTWKKRIATKPLQDPKELKNQEMSDAKKNSVALDGELAPMHGAKAFMQFIDYRATRRPEFLDRVAEIQTETAKEDAAKMAADMAKQKKQNERKK